MDRKEAILRFHRDVERSEMLVVQLLDMTGVILVQPRGDALEVALLAFLKHIRCATEQTDVVENPDSLRDSLKLCDCLAHELCHGDFLASLIAGAARRPMSKATF